MKFLVIVALFVLLLLLLYSRLYPYLQALKKILTAARTLTDSGLTSNTTSREGSKTDSKLVRCVGCGTWVPAARAVGTNAGSSVYCSRECLEKSAASDKRKVAS